MANGRIGMLGIKEVFRLDEMGFAKLKIHQITGLSRYTITTYLLAEKNANIHSVRLQLKGFGLLE